MDVVSRSCQTSTTQPSGFTMRANSFRVSFGAEPVKCLTGDDEVDTRIARPVASALPSTMLKFGYAAR